LIFAAATLLVVLNLLTLALAFAGILPPGKFYAWDDEPGELPPLYLNMASDKEKKPKWTLVQGG
jgi:hypothetical protein